MADTEFTPERLLEQASGNQSAIFLVGLAWAKQRDGVVDGWAEFVGDQFADMMRAHERIDEQLQAGFRVASGPVSSGDFTLEKFEATGTAEKNLRLHSKDEPWFEGLRANATAVASAVRNSEFAVDTVSGQLDQNGSLITISNVKVQRGSNQIVSNASVRLRADEKDFIKQPATIQIAIDAPETADFWNGNSLNRVSGTLNASGIVQWNGAVADGWFNVYGSKLQIRNLSVPQLSTAGSIWQSRIFLNDLTAKLNQRDFVNGQGTLDLQGEKKFAGKLVVDIADMSTLKRLFRKIARQNHAGVRVSGVEDMLVRFGKCCSPVPGDGIVGFITRGRGLTVHARDCLTVVKNVLDKERLVTVEWGAAEPAKRPVDRQAPIITKEEIEQAQRGQDHKQK